MIDEGKQQKYDEQISEIVRNFVQVWIKFEAMLHNKKLELQIRDGIDNNVGSEPLPNTVLELVYRISSCIHLLENPTMGELSNALSLPFSTATRMVDYLVDRGYIHRLADTTDRRVVRVALTNEGEEIHRFIENCSAERVQQMLRCLTDDERSTLFALINKISSSIKESTN
jgi:DNA-binding MarR family transcriptional regulator